MIDSVLAGKPDFVALLSPTVKSRAGSEPRVANDPRQAFAFCAQTGGLLVVQYAGQEWLPVVRDLRSLCGEGISLVVAVSPDKLTEVSSLQHAGADEVVPWEGKTDAVAWAIERVLSARGPGAVRSTPTPVPSVVTYVAPAGSPPPVLQRGPAAPAIAPARATTPAAGAEAAAGPAVPGAAPLAWPATIPGGDESARLLAAAVAGAAGNGPLAEAASRAAQKLSLPEREAMAGGPLPVDDAVVRRAAVLRFRVAVALQAVPRAGEPCDAGAVQALLAEIDGVLAELKVLGEGAPPEIQPGLDALRSGLVSEAIDLTEAVQRLGPAGVPEPVASGVKAERKAPPRKAERAAPAEYEVQVASDGTGRGALVVFLVLAALAAGGFHVHRYLTRPPAASFQRTGAPTDTVAAQAGPGKPVVIVKQSGAFEPAEVAQIKAQEEMRGNTVRQVAPGTLVIRPAGSQRGAGARPPDPTQGAKP